MIQTGSLLDNKYKILRKIGYSDNSVVYLVLNENVSDVYVAKEIRKNNNVNSNTFFHGLISDSETLKSLNHPNLSNVVDVIEQDDSFVIVMDYIEGTSLDKVLEEHGALSQDFVVETAKQICDVIRYLHSYKPSIIFRNITAANIIITPDGKIVLVGFGTAKTYAIDLKNSIGSIGCAAPEQCTGAELGKTDVRTDIYCLGTTLYHLFTGIDPCENLIIDRSVRKVNPVLAPGLDEIVLKCTQVNPDDRYQSCDELLYDLEHYGKMDDIYRKKQKRKLSVFIASVFLTIVFALISVFGYFSAQDKKSEDNRVQIENENSTVKSQPEKNDIQSATD